MVLAILALAVPAHADALKDALSRLQQRYDGTNTMQADFRQTVESKTLAGTLESKGKVAFEKPNRMRWDYDPPDAQTIVGDGETLWIYQPDLKQVIKAPLSQAFQSSTPVSFLAGLGRVERDFDATLERDEAEHWVLKLVPKQKRRRRRHARAGRPQVGRQRGGGPGHRCGRHDDADLLLGRAAQRHARAGPVPLLAAARG